MKNCTDWIKCHLRVQILMTRYYPSFGWLWDKTTVMVPCRRQRPPIVLRLNEREVARIHFPSSIPSPPSLNRSQRILLYIWTTHLTAYSNPIHFLHTPIPVRWSVVSMLKSIDVYILASSSAVAEKVGSSTKKRQIVVEMPENIDISPSIIFRYLADKLANRSDDQNDVSAPSYLIRPKQTTLSLSSIIDTDGARHRTSPSDHSESHSTSSSEVRFSEKLE